MSCDKPAAIVTGGAQGLGFAIVRELLSEGYRVCVVDVQEETGNETVKNLQKEFGESNVTFHVCDVTQRSQIKRVIDYVLQKFKRFDLLCNNAGIMNENAPEKTLAVNMLSVIYGTELATEYMGKQCGGKGGTVLNTASITGLVPLPYSPIYCASKHAVVGYTRSYGNDFHYKKSGIMFHALCPYFISTPLLEDFKTSCLEPGLNVTKVQHIMDPKYVAKGALKLIKDRQNGSVLAVTSEEQLGYKYIGLGDLEGFAFQSDNLKNVK